MDGSYLQEPLIGPVLCDSHHNRCHHQGPDDRVDSELPSSLPLPSARIDLHHDEHNIEGGAQVEELEAEIPQRAEASMFNVPRAPVEQIQIAKDENDPIEQLCKE